MHVRADSPSRRLSRSRDERGFTMLLALYVLIITTLLIGASYIAVLGDSGLSRNDLDQHRAYAAAQAGIAQYGYDLNQNPNYWESCATPSGTVGASDSGSTESYSIRPVPASGSGYSTCNATNPIGSMIQGSGAAAAGTFRIASTGTSNNVSRTVVAQYSRENFLSYVYFTNYEDSDPEWAPDGGLSCAVYAWAGRSASCAATAFGAGDAVNGPLHSNDNVGVCTGSGSTTTFGRPGVSPSDAIETPNVLAEGTSCGASSEIVMNGTTSNSVGTLPLPPNDTQLLSIADGGVSANNDGCYSGAGCVFTGPTTIVLDGPTSGINYMTVTNAGYNNDTAATLVFPSNGVVYVNATTTCSYAYSPFGSENQLYGGTTLDPSSTDTDNAGCGDAVVAAATSASSCTATTQVSGVCPYTQSLTIGAADDIIIASSLPTTTTTTGCAGGESAGCPTGTATLGLVADHNVRIAHALGSARWSGETEQSCLQSSGGTPDAYLNTNAAPSVINPVIDAAILAVNDSFIVDDFDCGSTSNSTPGAAPSQLGTLTVNGAIAQNFRGRVAEYNPQISGYTKSYWYDPRLVSIPPPYFLNPVGTTWAADRITECDSLASC
jgi:Tfp pilus assembly protein PilX